MEFVQRLRYTKIGKIIQEIPGVANISDALVVHGKDRREHDRRFKRVFNRLKVNGQPLNRENSVFGVEEIEFLGHRLSKARVDPGQDRI